MKKQAPPNNIVLLLSLFMPICSALILLVIGCAVWWLLDSWYTKRVRSQYLSPSTRQPYTQPFTTQAEMTNLLPATVIKVHDGDTLRATIHLPYDVDLPNRSIRAQDFDAWEINRVRKTVKITDEELRRGKLAKAELERLLSLGRLYLQPVKGADGAYNRETARWWIDTSDGWLDVAKHMIDHGHHRHD